MPPYRRFRDTETGEVYHMPWSSQQEPTPNDYATFVHQKMERDKTWLGWAGGLAEDAWDRGNSEMARQSRFLDPVNDLTSMAEGVGSTLLGMGKMAITPIAQQGQDVANQWMLNQMDRQQKGTDSTAATIWDAAKQASPIPIDPVVDVAQGIGYGTGMTDSPISPHQVAHSVGELTTMAGLMALHPSATEERPPALTDPNAPPPGGPTAPPPEPPPPGGINIAGLGDEPPPPPPPAPPVAEAPPIKRVEQPPDIVQDMNIHPEAPPEPPPDIAGQMQLQDLQPPPGMQNTGGPELARGFADSMQPQELPPVADPGHWANQEMAVPDVNDPVEIQDQIDQGRLRNQQRGQRIQDQITNPPPPEGTPVVPPMEPPAPVEADPLAALSDPAAPPPGPSLMDAAREAAAKAGVEVPKAPTPKVPKGLKALLTRAQELGIDVKNLNNKKELLAAIEEAKRVARVAGKKENGPFRYNLDDWKAEQEQMGNTPEEIDAAVRETTSQGIDPTKSEDFHDLEYFLNALEDKSDPAWKQEQTEMGHYGKPEIIDWHKKTYPPEAAEVAAEQQRVNEGGDLTDPNAPQSSEEAANAAHVQELLAQLEASLGTKAADVPQGPKGGRIGAMDLPDMTNPEAPPVVETPPAPKPVKPKGATPDRVLRIGRGAHDPVRVTFPDALHADLFSAIGRMRKAVSGDKAGIPPQWGRLAKAFGVPESEIGRIAQAYREKVMAQVKGVPKAVEGGLAEMEAPGLNDKVVTPKEHPVVADLKAKTAKVTAKLNAKKEAVAGELADKLKTPKEAEPPKPGIKDMPPKVKMQALLDDLGSMSDSDIREIAGDKKKLYKFANDRGMKLGAVKQVIAAHLGDSKVGGDVGALSLPSKAQLKKVGRGVYDVANELRMTSFLSGLGLPKSLIGDVGAHLTAALEGWSFKPVRALFNVKQIAQDMQTGWKNNVNPAQTPGVGHINVFGKAMGAGDYAALESLKRAGVSEADAKEILLTNANVISQWKALQSGPGKFMFPFVRISANVLEQGLTRWRKYPAIYAGAVALGAAVGGTIKNKEALAMTAAFAGPYALPFLFGAGLRQGMGTLDNASPLPEWGITKTIKDPFGAFTDSPGKRWFRTNLGFGKRAEMEHRAEKGLPVGGGGGGNRERGERGDRQ